MLWPLFHCINTNFFNEGLLESFMEQYEAYAHANQCYLEVGVWCVWCVWCVSIYMSDVCMCIYACV